MFVLASTAPRNLSAIANSSTSINLTWNKPTSFKSFPAIICILVFSIVAALSTFM